MPVQGWFEQTNEAALFCSYLLEVVNLDICDTNLPAEVPYALQVGVLTPPLAYALLGLPNVDQEVTSEGEVNPWCVWKRAPLIPGNRGQVEHVFERFCRHLAYRHSSRARRSSRTTRLFRLRSSSFAHATKPACRSGGNRTKNETTFSAMTAVYICYSLATIVAQ